MVTKAKRRSRTKGRARQFFSVRWLSAALFVMLMAWAGSYAYMQAGSAARYAVAAEAEDANFRSPSRLVFERRGEEMSGSAAVQFGVGGQCNVVYDQELADQLDASTTRYNSYTWPNAVGKPAIVYFETGKLSAEYRGYTVQAVDRWTKIVPECLDARAVTTCPANVNCVQMDETDDPNPTLPEIGPYLGVFWPKVDPSARKYVNGSKITLSRVPLSQLPAIERQATTTHEVGHAFGLHHRKMVTAVLAVQNFGNGYVLDNIDRANIFTLYGVRYFDDGTPDPAQFASPSAPPVELSPVVD